MDPSCVCAVCNTSVLDLARTSQSQLKSFICINHGEDVLCYVCFWTNIDTGWARRCTCTSNEHYVCNLQYVRP